MRQAYASARSPRTGLSGGDAARVFAQIGPETLPEVIKALEGVLKTDVSERPKVVLWALRGFGESAAPAGPAVTRALTHANANVRHAAAETLGEIGPQALERGARSYFWSKAYLWRSSCRRRVAE